MAALLLAGSCFGCASLPTVLRGPGAGVHTTDWAPRDLQFQRIKKWILREALLRAVGSGAIKKGEKQDKKGKGAS